MAGLSAEKPERVRGIVDCEAPGRELGSTSRNRLESRVNTLLGRGHDRAWVSECRLRDSMVLCAELEVDGVTDGSSHATRVVFKTSITDENGYVSSRCNDSGGESDSKGGETHFFRLGMNKKDKMRVGLCVRYSEQFI